MMKAAVGAPGESIDEFGEQISRILYVGPAKSASEMPA
jgi:hypothetical protein